MMSELLPCPFCGSETYLYEAKDYYALGCENIGCHGNWTHSRVYETKEEAIEAWNTRAERTCRIVENERYSDMYDGPIVSCTQCEAPLPKIFTGPYNFCPNCGAKVIQNV